MDKTEQHKKAMLEALEKSLGVVTSACKRCRYRKDYSLLMVR